MAAAHSQVAHAAEPTAVTLTTLSEKSIAQSKDWAVRLPNEVNVEFRGVLSNEASGGSGGAMLYPAPHIGGFVAALVTHGLLNSANRRREASAQQEAANKVLDPYRGIIGDLRHDELFQLALTQLSARPQGKMRIAVQGEAPGGDWMFVTEPVFSMTQDQNALVLDSAVVVYAPNSPAAPIYQNALRVVSAPIATDDALVFWSEQSGRNLRALSAQLMAMTFDLVSDDINNGAVKKGDATGAAHRTVRYLHGKSEKMERAELMRVNCDRAVIKTLRGGVMSVPLKQSHSYAVSPGSETADCVGAEKK
jgi:hypothetical protein